MNKMNKMNKMNSSSSPKLSQQINDSNCSAVVSFCSSVFNESQTGKNIYTFPYEKSEEEK